MFPLFAAQPGSESSPEFRDGEDARIWREMPDDLKDQLRGYYQGLAIGKERDRESEGLPCLWYDSTARRCLHYQHRPQACRDFEPGNPDCLRLRREALMEEPSANHD